MPYFHSGDVKLYYQDEGRGDTIVFLHGFTCDHRMWASQFQYFSANHRVVVLDSRGHGKSDAPKTNYSRDHRIADLLVLLDELKLEKIHLVGLSMGGSTAIGFALKHQDRLKSLTLVSTGAAGYSPGKKVEMVTEIAQTKGIKAAKKKWLEWTTTWFKERDPQIGQLMTDMANDHSGAIWIDPMRGKYPRTVDLENAHKITVPTFIVVGELDKIFLPLAEGLHKSIKNSRISVFENAGHMVNLEFPQKFNRELSQFLLEADNHKNDTSTGSV